MGKLCQTLAHQITIHRLPIRRARGLHVLAGGRGNIGIREIGLPTQGGGILITTAECKIGRFVADLDQLSMHEAHTPIQRMDLVIAPVRLHHHARRLGLAKEIRHHRAHDRQAESMQRLLRRRNQQMHPHIARLDAIAGVHWIRGWSVALQQKTGCAVEQPQIGGAARLGVQPSVKRSDIGHRGFQHAPVTGIGLASPLLDLMGVHFRHQ